MANNETWTVRGVGEEARRVAKAAAASAGWSLGRWLEQAIGLAAEHTVPKKSAEAVVEIPPYVPPFEHKTVVELAAELPAEPIRSHQQTKGRTRAVCQHGVEKGWNCWQCGGKAVIR